MSTYYSFNLSSICYLFSFNTFPLRPAKLTKKKYKIILDNAAVLHYFENGFHNHPTNKESH